MPDAFYPTVSIEFLRDCILNSDRVEQDSLGRVGSTTSFATKGRQSLHRRIVVIRELKGGEVGIEQATGIAVRLGFLEKLMDWLEENKRWKQGAYKI